ncbi:MAG: SRPBCC domain-containing protein [Leifsonia sp.]
MPETLATSSKHFTITRVFDAPRDVIWRAWTDPAEATHWLHPRGFTTPIESVRLDNRVGGTYAYTMVGPDGSEYSTGGEYLEITEPERLVMTWGDPDRPDEPQPVLEIELRDRGESTEMVFTVRGVDGAPGDHNVYDGWVSAFDVLVERLAG